MDVWTSLWASSAVVTTGLTVVSIAWWRMARFCKRLEANRVERAVEYSTAIGLPDQDASVSMAVRAALIGAESHTDPEFPSARPLFDGAFAGSPIIQIFSLEQRAGAELTPDTVLERLAQAVETLSPLPYDEYIAQMKVGIACPTPGTDIDTLRVWAARKGEGAIHVLDPKSSLSHLELEAVTRGFLDSHGLGAGDVALHEIAHHCVALAHVALPFPTATLLRLVTEVRLLSSKETTAGVVAKHVVTQLGVTSGLMFLSGKAAGIVGLVIAGASGAALFIPIGLCVGAISGRRVSRWIDLRPYKDEKKALDEVVARVSAEASKYWAEAQGKVNECKSAHERQFESNTALRILLQVNRWHASRQERVRQLALDFEAALRGMRVSLDQNEEAVLAQFRPDFFARWLFNATGEPEQAVRQRFVRMRADIDVVLSEFSRATCGEEKHALVVEWLRRSPWQSGRMLEAVQRYARACQEHHESACTDVKDVTRNLANYAKDLRSKFETESAKIVEERTRQLEALRKEYDAAYDRYARCAKQVKMRIPPAGKVGARAA